jgi:uridine kinase
VTRDDLLVAVAGRMLALPDDRPRLVAVTGMSGVGKTTLAGELAEVVSGAGRPVRAVAYDDFHHPAPVRHRQDRLSAEGYLQDSYDAAALRARVLDPLARGERAIRPASLDLADDTAVDPEPVAVAADAVVLVEGEFLLAPVLAADWDLAVLLVAEPSAVLARAMVRDADLGSPAQLRELYLRRYFRAWALHEERHDPWSRAGMVVDLTDPLAPELLAGG